MASPPTSKSFLRLQHQIISCTKCPRLVAWREQVAAEKVKRFQHETYWGRPVPAFGDPNGRLLIVGLAPAAHGGNRTGRIFTGDRSGDWLYRALHKFGFANQPTSVHRDDGLELKDCLITATIRCAPPQNRPLPSEMLNCRPYLLAELRLLRNLCVVVALGKIAFDTAISSIAEVHGLKLPRKPAFKHGAEISLSERITLIASFHPSQQNTFTGRLTEEMFDAIFARARALLERS